MIWLPDGSVGQCGMVRAILLPRFGQSVLKMGGVVWVCVCVCVCVWCWWGGGGGKSHTWTFLETITHRALDKVNVYTYTRLIKSDVSRTLTTMGQHTNLTDNHGFWKITNWKWVTTDGVDLFFLCSVLQPSDPTHASECPGGKRGQGWRTGEM